MGGVAGNFLGFHTTDWINFLATFGAGLLTFLAGAEIDPDSLRRHLKPALTIGVVSFLVPFLAVTWCPSRTRCSGSARMMYSPRSTWRRADPTRSSLVGLFGGSGAVWTTYDALVGLV